MADQDLTTLASVRAFLELSATDTSRDTLFGTLITQASDVIARHCGREFAPATAHQSPNATRTLRFDPTVRAVANGPARIDLYPFDLRTITTAHLHYGHADQVALTAGTDIVLEPANHVSGGAHTAVLIAPGVNLTGGATFANFGYSELRINGDWGFSAIPEDVEYAANLTVSSWLRRDIAAYDIDAGEGRGLGPDAPTVYSLPLAAVRILEHYRRRPV